ncbi:MAG: D-alanyl-D-alanine carboxypeptidase family protein [Dethiobacteria bacterium]|jgi:D-alanyl-D-alanine carboxypeptidase (penicillin-binding protein 5/6)
MKRKLFAVCFLIFFTLLIFPLGKGQAFEGRIQSKAALLMEYKTGEILFAVNEHEKLYPASLTKIMTMLLALEALERGEISLDDQVPVTKYAESMGGSTIFLSAGDVVDMESLLIGMAVGSANDASVAVAEYISGSETGFVEIMNRRADELGMKNTNFVNANGLHHDDHYTTAFDVALMSRELMSYPIFTRWVSIWMDENFLEGKIKSEKVYLSNTNRLIHYYEGCDGVKTGYTDKAMHCISATAEKDGTRFIAVVLNSPTSDIRYEEAQDLLNYGFANFYTLELADKREKVARLPVEKGTAREIDILTTENLSLLIKKGDEPQYRTELELPKRLEAPVLIEKKVGKIKVMQGDTILKEVDLEVARDVAGASLTRLFRRYLETWLKFGR